MSILSIQSHVVYGHVGNNAAVLPLQRLGHEVWPLPTVLFSNHPGHGGWRGEALDPGLVEGLAEGLAERGLLAGCRAVLTGYLRNAAVGRAALAAVARVRQASPDAIWCCDPVLGDRDVGLYVDAALPALLAAAIAGGADILTPNAFELAALTGRPVEGLDAAVAAGQRLRAGLRPGGPRLVLCTSLPASGPGDGDTVDSLLLSDAGTHLIRVPRLAGAPRGPGDLLSALLLGRYLAGSAPLAAAELAISSVWGILRASVAAGSAELELVAAQDEIVAPGRVFQAQKIG